jgi:hypothetical protein
MNNFERAIQLVADYRVYADSKFNSVIQRGRKGERNLELAAAAAAGMEHAARNILNRLRDLEGKDGQKV